MLIWACPVASQFGRSGSKKELEMNRIESNTTLISRKKAAELLGLKPETLATWASTKRYSIPFVKVGRCVRYRLSDLAKFVETNIHAQINGDEK